MPHEKKSISQKQSTKLYALLAMTGSMTFFLISPLFVFLFLGMWLDQILHTSPFCMIGGAIIGFIGGMMSILFFLKDR